MKAQLRDPKLGVSLQTAQREKKSTADFAIKHTRNQDVCVADSTHLPSEKSFSLG